MMSARAPCKSALKDLITSSTDGWAGGAAGAWDCAAAAEAMSDSASTTTNESGLRTEYPPILVTSTLDLRFTRAPAVPRSPGSGRDQDQGQECQETLVFPAMWSSGPSARSAHVWRRAIRNDGARPD